MPSFANYSEFRTAVLKMIDGDDVSTSFSIDTLDLLISLGETLVYNGDAETDGLRASSMVADLSVVLAGNEAALPADLLQLREARFSGESPLDIVPLDRVRRLVEGSVGAGAAQYAAQDGDSLVFWPAATGTLLGSYYKRHEPLKTGTWADQTTFARYPETFLYAALLQSAPFIGEDARLPVWDRLWRSSMEAASRAERGRTYGGGSLRVRTR